MDALNRIRSFGESLFQEIKTFGCDCQSLKKIAAVALFILAGAAFGAFIATKVITLPLAIVLLLSGAPTTLIQLVACRVAITGAMIGGTIGGIGACNEKDPFHIR